jgi:competence protein ComEA
MLKKILAVMAMLFYAAASYAAVDVNKATAAELDGIKGIGPGISGKIVEERKKGTFKDWQDFIDRVKGVGEGNAAKFSEGGLTVNGSAFKGAAAKKDDKAAAKKDEKPAAKEAAKKDDKPAAKDTAKKDDKPAAKDAAKKDDKAAAKDAPKKEAKAEAAKPAASAKK